MKMILPVALCLALSNTAQAGQNYSRSLTECSAIYTAMLMKPAAVARNTRDGGQQVRDSAIAYLDRAMVEARREGRQRPALVVTADHNELMQKWTPKVYAASAITETKDWLDYCHSFGAHLGLPTLRPTS